MWIREEDKIDKDDDVHGHRNATDGLLSLVALLPTPTFFSDAEKVALTERHKRVKNAIVQQFQYGSQSRN